MNDYITCKSCGIVLDKTCYAIPKEERLNHDGDMVSEHIQCPVCNEWTSIEEWRKL